MAEAEDDNSTKWILVLGDYYERRTTQLGSARLADRLVRKDLNEGRLKDRILTATEICVRKRFTERLLGRFQPVISCEFSALRPAKPISPDPLNTWIRDIIARSRAVEDSMHVFRTGQPPPLRQPPAPAMSPAIEIFASRYSCGVSGQLRARGQPNWYQRAGYARGRAGRGGASRIAGAGEGC